MPRGRVLLVDPSEEWLAALSALLAEDPDLEVVGRARAAGDAVQRAVDLRPDLVLVETALPDASGFEAAERLKALPCPPLVLLMTSDRRRTVGLAAILAGADGCLFKAHLGHRLLPILRELLLRDGSPPDGSPSASLRRLHKDLRS